MKTRKLLGAVIAFFLLAALASAADITGVWNGSSSGGQQGPTQFTMNLHRANGVLSGTLSVNGEDLPMDQLKLDGAAISFQLATDGGTYTVKGTVHGDKMSGTYASDSDNGTWQAERAKSPQPTSAPSSAPSAGGRA